MAAGRHAVCLSQTHRPPAGEFHDLQRSAVVSRDGCDGCLRVAHGLRCCLNGCHDGHYGRYGRCGHYDRGGCSDVYDDPADAQV